MWILRQTLHLSIDHRTSVERPDDVQDISAGIALDASVHSRPCNCGKLASIQVQPSHTTTTSTLLYQFHHTELGYVVNEIGGPTLRPSEPPADSDLILSFAIRATSITATAWIRNLCHAEEQWLGAMDALPSANGVYAQVNQTTQGLRPMHGDAGPSLLVSREHAREACLSRIAREKKRHSVLGLPF